MVLEVTLALDAYRNNFNTMALKTLGVAGQWIASGVVLVLLYALTAAYIDGDVSLLTMFFRDFLHVDIPHWANALIFTLVFGSIVFWSMRAVDVINRGLISLKGFALMFTIGLLFPQIQYTQLFGKVGNEKYLWVAAPIFLTCFGFHTVIPSLVNYIGKDVKALRKVVIWGSTIPLIIYLFWLLGTLGVLPLSGPLSFEAWAHDHGSVGSFIEMLDKQVHNHLVVVGINTFSNIAVTTSFLGVTLGLFDFLADGFGRSNSRGDRFITALITYTPPLCFAWFYPQGFVMALGYAALCITILEVMMPPLMVFSLRCNPNLNSPYRLWGGNTLLWVVFAIGALLAVVQMMSSFHLLPVFAML